MVNKPEVDAVKSETAVSTKPEAPVAEKASAVSTFEKEQILRSECYRDMRDLLAALLKDGVRYSHADIGVLVEGFMNER